MIWFVDNTERWSAAVAPGMLYCNDPFISRKQNFCHLYIYKYGKKLPWTKILTALPMA